MLLRKLFAMLEGLDILKDSLQLLGILSNPVVSYSQPGQ